MYETPHPFAVMNSTLVPNCHVLFITASQLITLNKIQTYTYKLSQAKEDRWMYINPKNLSEKDILVTKSKLFLKHNKKA